LQVRAENFAGSGGQNGRLWLAKWQAAGGIQRATPAGCDDDGGELYGVAVATRTAAAHCHQAGRV